MRSFFKIFFATLLALIVFVVIFIAFSIGVISNLGRTAEVETGSNAVLVIDLSVDFAEKQQVDPLAGFSESHYNTPGLYDVIRMIRYAKTDSSVKGLYLKASSNANGLGNSEEIRNALIDFKTSHKFVYAYGDVISMKSYFVANVADRIYCNPKGSVEWRGFTTIMGYFKTGLEKLEIEPEIFYAGKFKSATEPLRADKMSDANRLQLTTLLNDFFDHVMVKTANARGIDTSSLRSYVDEHLINSASDAIKYKLVDDAKYNDEVLEEIAGKVKSGSIQGINFVSLGRYYEAVSAKIKSTGSDRIALIYAEGNIIGGKSSQKQIGEDAYRQIIRKVRLDNDIKAIVLRISSGGGSALVSENLWRELTLAKASKPVVISFGDISASGGYYMSCNADSIFAEPLSITGSIGVFSMTFNTQAFFKNKLGVTFDGVHTAKNPDALTIFQPMTEMQKRFIQNDVDSTYLNFKTRVAEGRKKDLVYVDSIAQGRVWSGDQALRLGLIDKLGGLQDAVDCAVRMAKLKSYRLREYPEPENLLDLLLNNYKQSVKANTIEENLGKQGADWYQMINDYKDMSGVPQTRIPYTLNFLP